MAERENARHRKDYAAADALQLKLAAVGVTVAGGRGVQLDKGASTHPAALHYGTMGNTPTACAWPPLCRDSIAVIKSTKSKTKASKI